MRSATNKFIHRRNVSLYLIYLSVIVSILAASCTISNQHISENKIPYNTKILLLYYSLYGSTKQVSEWIAEGIDGKTDVVSISDFSAINVNDYTVIILGSAVYMENVALPMKDFLKEHRDSFKQKDVALFVVSGSYLISGTRYISLFEEELEKKPAITAFFGGKMIPEKLSEFHFKIMEKYWADRGQEVQFFDFTDKSEAIEFGQKIRKLIAKGTLQ